MTDRPRQLLYFTNNDSGRDVEITLPVLHFAERFLNCEVRATLTTNIHEIHRLRPDCVVVANTIGALLHFHISREAHKLGIPVFALISEGNFKTDGSFDYWGYNTDKIFYQSYLCCWSRRTRDFLREELPQMKDRIVLTGGTGFDRYRIYQFESRRPFLSRHGVDPAKFDRIIGYAGWGFGKLAHPRGRSELLNYFKGDAAMLDWAETQRLAVEDILRRSIEAHPDTLFILKKHPTETVAAEPGAEDNEMAALKDYPNVLYLLDEQLHDLINIVDLWWVYESTTALEADMMGKQTLFIVPDPDFPRVTLFEGFPQAESFEEVDAMSETFFTSGNLPGYRAEERIQRRREIVRETIGYDDGCNHIRAAYYLKRTLEQPPRGRRARLSLYYFFVYWTLRALVPLYRPNLFAKIPWLRRKLWVFDKYPLRGLPELKARYEAYLDKFYEDANIAERFKQGTLFDDLLDSPPSEKT
ncbi:hypothetical protein DDZ13_01445 [Coraliomargarita sinensis]|uniref:Uncharacterized protein n=1 Tax=Coraliomargarita sinensis TaxID=2174842 RepID=A0A317ZIX2_9BACT|nr:hypothetical protein [Coraliomargarita sinensis]PXA05565.1 hypothetical protein DDZ13_01445 [Coraliomargarita sinensis]